MTPNTYIGKNEKIDFFDRECMFYGFFLIYFLVNKLANVKKNFWLAIFFQKIVLKVTFDFRAPYRPLYTFIWKIRFCYIIPML